jgi:ribokinase
MKIINFGSLNIDNVYYVDNFVLPGQTIFATTQEQIPGGKGLNQSVAAARTDAKIQHAGCVGTDGQFMLDLLYKAGVDISAVNILEKPSGHAIIEVNKKGQNRIIVFGSTNQLLTENYIDTVLKNVEKDDIVLLQNETNLVGTIIVKAASVGARVAFNPSPMPNDLESLPLDKVSFFIVNELEAAQLADNKASENFEETLDILSKKFPNAAIIMTLGSQGALYKCGSKHVFRPIFKVKTIDTTAAGDTFCGYFLACLTKGLQAEECLETASAASAITVSGKGAAPSIPTIDQVRQFISERKKDQY